MRRIAAFVLGTAIAAALAPAAAQAGEIPAPSTRAAAELSASGTLLKEKNIDKAWRADTGKYCVTLADEVPVDEVVIQINPRQYRTSTYTTKPAPWCDREANTVTIGLQDREGNYANGGLTLVAQ